VAKGSIFSSASFSRALAQARSGAGAVDLDSDMTLDGACTDGRPGPPIPTVFKSTAIQSAMADLHPSLARQRKLDMLDPEMLELIRGLDGYDECFHDHVGDSEALDVGNDSIMQSRDLDSSQLPYLIVSNSRSFFPLGLALDSPYDPQNLKITPARSMLAYRRGRNAPTPLSLARLKPKHQQPSGIAYPGMPTPFLGSPSYAYESPCSAGDDKGGDITPGMRAEDMIHNLRLKCSAMAPRTPPIAAVSAISRSQHLQIRETTSSQLPDASDEASIDEWAFANSLLVELQSVEDATFPTLPTPSNPRKEVVPPSKGKSLLTPSHQITTFASRRPMYHTPKKILSTTSPTASFGPRHRTPVSSPMPLGNVPKTPSRLRSSMVQSPASDSKVTGQSTGKKSLKNVRFAVKETGIEDSEILTVHRPLSLRAPIPKKLGSNVNHTPSRKIPPARKQNVQSSSSPASVRAPLAPRPPSLPMRVTPKRPVTSNATPGPKPKEPAFRRSTPVQPIKERDNSLSGSVGFGSPLRHSFVHIDNVSFQSETDTPTPVDLPLQEVQNVRRSSTITLGRGLSRIIKGPILTLKENKRATISAISSSRGTSVQNDENAARRGSGEESDALPSGRKKSRMSGPLRNIFKARSK